MDSKRFHLTIYRVLHEESESGLKNDQILQLYAVFSIFRTRKILKKYKQIEYGKSKKLHTVAGFGQF